MSDFPAYSYDMWKTRTPEDKEDRKLDENQCVRCGRERLSDSAFCAACDWFVSEFGDVVYS